MNMRIAGINIPEKKRLEYGLTAVYGIGHARAQKILEDSGIELDARPEDLSTNDENKIRKSIESYRIEGDLRREKATYIKHLKDIKSYRGTRHLKGLPARGQKTKKNSRTVRGNVRKTMGSGKRKLEKK